MSEGEPSAAEPTFVANMLAVLFSQAGTQDARQVRALGPRPTCERRRIQLLSKSRPNCGDNRLGGQNRAQCSKAS
jgi:hypothetical protein